MCVRIDSVKVMILSVSLLKTKWCACLNVKSVSGEEIELPGRKTCLELTRLLSVQRSVVHGVIQKDKKLRALNYCHVYTKKRAFWV